MSADPQRKAYKYTCSMIRPQIYSEKSLMESVVDFFSDVVPQAYTGAQKNEDREKIQWVRFENCDCNDVAKNPDMFRSDTKGLPLLLILGYSNGVQIWHITPNGEAQEVLSMRQGPVRICRILPNPDLVLGNGDSYSHKRPLIVMCDSTSAGQPYCGVKFVSLKTGDEVHSISYKTLPVQNIECNKRFLVNIFLEKVCVYETCQFQQLFWITSCYPCSGPTVNPIALSTRWLAYADKRLVAMHQSCGGMSGDGSQSYAATVISAAKGAFKGLSMFGEAMVSSVTGCKPSPVKRDCVTLDNGNRPGIVTVVDIQNIHNDHFNVNEDNEGDGLIAHFHAHANEPVSNMAFDPTGTLLVTACKLGHNFHVFRLMAHPVSSSLGAVHHLYTLHRGETTAKVIDISFNHDSRWITVSSHRGTTHLFPITPYGGPVNIRTHCKPHVVNRASRFHRSAGLDEFDHSVGRRSPVLSTSPSSSGQYDRYPTLIQQNTLNNNMGNPRLPPYPHPITIYPTFQVKQPLNVALNPGNKNHSPSHSPTGFDNVYCVCAKFCTPRLCVIGSPKLDVERRDGGKRPVDSLFVMAQSGTLVEYVLEPRAKSVSDKVTDDCLLELNVIGRMQWNLQRLKNSPELRPPLPSNSPLILANEAVVSQIPTAPDLYDLPGLTRQDSKDSLSSEHSSKDDSDEQWLSQVEIITHAGPHRRLWMGPQFSFKTYQENTTVLSSNSSSLLSQSPESNMAAMDMMGDEGDLESLKLQPARSNPVSMPNARPAYRRLSRSDSPSTVQGIGAQSVPLLIEAGSFDQSPHLLDVYSNWTESTVAKQPRGSDDMEEDRLKETLADAMVESPCKDIEKLSLRHQDIPRTSVRAEKRRGQSWKKNIVENNEGAGVFHKEKTETAKKESEMVKDNVVIEKNQHLTPGISKEKQGKGNVGEQSKGEEKVTHVKMSKTDEKDKTEPDKDSVASDTGKNSKKKRNSKRSIETQFTNFNTSTQKGEIKSTFNDTKNDVGKEKNQELGKPKEITAKNNDHKKEIKKSCKDSVIIDNDMMSNQGKPNEITAEKDSETNESSGESGSCVIDTYESYQTGKNKSAVNVGSYDDVTKHVSTARIDEKTAKIDPNTAKINEIITKDDTSIIEDDLSCTEIVKGRSNEIIKKDDQDSKKSVNLGQNLSKMKITSDSNEVKGNTRENEAKEQRKNESAMTMSVTGGQSKGKSKRKNKKQNRNSMSESMTEKSPEERKQEEKEPFDLTATGKEEAGNKENPFESTLKSIENLSVPEEKALDPEIDTVDKQELNSVSDIIASEIEEENTDELDEDNDTCQASPVQKLHSPNKSEDEKLSMTENVKSSNIKMQEEAKEFKNIKSDSLNDPMKECISSDFHTVVKSKRNRKENTIEKDFDANGSEQRTYNDHAQKRKTEKLKESERKEQEEKSSNMKKVDNNETHLEEVKNDQFNSLVIHSAVSDKEPEMPNLEKSDEDMFHVKSKKNRKKKKNMLESSCYSEIPKESEKQTVTDLNLQQSCVIKEEEIVAQIDEKQESVLQKGEHKSDEPSFVSTDKLTQICEYSVVSSRKDQIHELIYSKVDGEEMAFSHDKFENPPVALKSKVFETPPSEKNEPGQSEIAEEEMFVVSRRKGKKKKKIEEVSVEFPSSSESKETESILTGIGQAISEKKTSDGWEETDQFIEVNQVQIKESPSEIKEDKRNDDMSFDSKSKQSFGDKTFVDSVEEPLTVAEEDDEFGVIIEKKMEDSAESGSKYETADSAEDDPSAWERFEECSGENESEQDTAVESYSNISDEKSVQFYLEDGSDLPGRLKSVISASKSHSLDRIDMEKKNEFLDEDESSFNGNGKTSQLSKFKEDKSLVSKTNDEVGASAKEMSVYEDSTGSSSRSSEERDVKEKVKTSQEKESKSKKKKKKNRK